MEASHHAKEVAKGSFWGLLGNLTFKLSSFFYTVLIARAVSQGDVGLFYLALSIVSIIAVFSDIGLSSAITRYVPYFEGKNQHSKLRNLIDLSYKIILILGVVLSIALFLSADLIGQIYNNDGLPESLRIFSAFILIQNILRLDLSFLSGKADIKTTQLGSNVQNFTKLVFTAILFYLYGPSVSTLIIAFILSYIAAIIIVFPKLRSVISQLPAEVNGALNQEFLTEIVPLGMVISLIGTMYVILGSLDKILMGLVLDPSVAESALAIYSLAMGLAAAIGVFPAAVNSIFFPVIARIFGKGDNKEANALMQTSQRWSLFLIIPIAVVLILFSSDILRMLYGSVYQSGWIVLSVFTLGIVLNTVPAIITQALVAKRLVKIELQIVILATFTNLVLCLLLIPPFGIEGAAIGWLFSITMLTIATQYYGKKIFGFTSPPEVYQLLLAGIVSFFIVLLLKPVAVDLTSNLPVFDSSEFGNIISRLIYLAYLGILSILTGIIFVMVALALKCFHSEDISLMKSALRRAMVPQPVADFAVKIASYGVK